MSSSGDFKNEFSWSSNRSSIFQECKRKYYFQYYGSWGGWDTTCDDRTREIYILKNLKNRYMWLGIAVHDTVERIIKYLRSGRVLPEHEARENMLDRLRKEYRESREGKYRLDPKNSTGLTEHEYAEELDDEEWQRIRDRGITCLNNLYKLDLFDELQTSPPEKWLAIEGDLSKRNNFVDSFEIGDLTVWLKLDMAYRAGDGTVHIVDWKTGRSNPGFKQLYCYGYYAWKEWGIDPEQVTLNIVNLLDGETSRESLEMEHLELLEKEIEEEKFKMKDLLVDPESNTAREEDFPKVDNLSICRSCRYRKICYPEGISSSSDSSEINT